MIQKALDKAFELHKGQTRKATNIPYYVHILDVAKILMYETNNETLIVAGILHDTLEDTNYTKEEMIKDFGKEVYEIVNFCSEPGNDVNMNKEKGVKTWKKRKEHSINSIKNGTQEQLIVFISDKYSNLSSIRDDLELVGDELWNRFNASYEDIKWYYKSLRNESKEKLSKKRVYKLFNKLVDEVFE